MLSCIQQHACYWMHDCMAHSTDLHAIACWHSGWAACILYEVHNAASTKSPQGRSQITNFLVVWQHAWFTLGGIVAGQCSPSCGAWPAAARDQAVSPQLCCQEGLQFHRDSAKQGRAAVCHRSQVSSLNGSSSLTDTSVRWDAGSAGISHAALHSLLIRGSHPADAAE